MADQATFHAKISADAREFITQVESAGEAVKTLVNSTSAMGSMKVASAGGGSDAEAKQAEAKMKDLLDQAMAGSERVSEQNKQNIAEETAARRSATQQVYNEQETREEQIQRLMAAGITRRNAEQLAGQKVLEVNKKMLTAEENKAYARLLKYNRTKVEGLIREREEMNKLHGRAIQMNKDFDRRREIEQTQAIAREQRRINDAMVTGRYALYDMANTYRSVYRAAEQVTRFLAQGVVEAAKFESAFTSVERALQLDVDSALFNDLKEGLTDLSTQIPVTFADLSRIATLGAQMGIAAQDITSFTQTIASFASVTGVTVENAAEKFGRLASLANVPASEFENLGSAVYFAGINAVATEEQILSMSEQIAATATKAGFTADQIIGLSTALASVGLQPELSRGALMRIFDFMDRSVAGLTGKLDELAVVMGMTQQQATALFSEDPEAFFQKFLSGIGTVDNLTAAFDRLGLVNVRDRDLLTRLSQNMDVYTQSMNDANESYANGTALAEGFSRQGDDLEAMLSKLNNAIAALGAALGESTLKGLKPFIDFTIEALNAVRNFAKTPFGQILLPLAIGLTSAVGLFAAFVVGTSLAKASVLAMNVAMQKMAQLNGTMNFSLREMIQTLTGQTYVMTLSTGQMRVYTKASLDAAFAAGKLTEAQYQAAIAQSTMTTSTRGLTVALRALSFASIIGIGVTVIGVLAEMSGAFGNAEADIKAMGEAGINAAGGIERFAEALQKDADTRKRLTALEDVEGAQSKYNLALEKSIDLYNAYSGREPDVNQADADAADAVAQEYATVLLDSLRAYTKDGQTYDIFEQLIGLGPGTEALLRASGFDALQMVQAGIDDATGQGARKYAERYATLFDGVYQNYVRITQDMVAAGEATPFKPATFDMILNRMKELGQVTPEFAAQLKTSFQESGMSAEEFFYSLPTSSDFAFLYDAADAFEATHQEVMIGIGANERYEQSVNKVGEEAETTAFNLGEITDEVTTLIDAIFSADLADADLASAFDEFAASVLKAGNDFSIYTEEGRQNITNFKDFVTSAFEEATNSGTGVVGALQNIAGGLSAMEAKGIDVSTMMGTFREIVVQTLYEAALAGGTSTASLALLAAEIEGMPPGTTLDVILQKLFGITTAATVAAQAQAQLNAQFGDIDPATGKLIAGTTAATSNLIDFASVLEGLMDSIGKTIGSGSSVSKAKDEMEELGDETSVAADKLSELGKSIEENGLEFDRWSQTGSQNVMALMAVMEALRVEAGGDVQQLANWLAALRDALIRAGASAGAVAIINAEIAKLGVTATATAADIDSMYAALTQAAAESASAVKKSSEKTKKEFIRLAEAISQVASDIGKNLDTLFGRERAIDAITMGWLDLVEGADKARESIAEAEQQIIDIGLSIDETRASIEGLTADKSKLEYQLQIALKYGDAIRAQEIQAELAKIDAEIAKEQQNIADSQQQIADAEEAIRKAQSELGMDSTVQDLIERNRALEDMAELYADLAAILLIDAKTQQERKDVIQEQTEAFYQNAIAAGYSAEEARRVADALAMSLAEVDIPSNIRDPFYGVRFDTSDAMDSIRQFVDEANERLSTLTENLSLPGYQLPDLDFLYGGPGGGGSNSPGRGDSLTSRPSGGPNDRIKNEVMLAMQAADAVQIGLDYFSPINTTKPALGKTGSQIGTVSPREMMMNLSPQDRALLRAALERPINLYADSTTIATTANTGNTILARRNRR